MVASVSSCILKPYIFKCEGGIIIGNRMHEKESVEDNKFIKGEDSIGEKEGVSISVADPGPFCPPDPE